MPVRDAARATVLLMPGRYSRAEDFERNDFVAAVHRRNIDVELVAVDAHLGYYLEERYQSLPSIVYEDIVRPRLEHGRQRVWLVGTSLGALGSLAYAKKYPETVAGLLLLGAYLGEKAIISDLERAGGLERWQPTAGVGYDYEVRTWDWLRGYTTHQPRPTLFLGYGRGDRFATGNDLLANALPKTHVLVAESGNHDFATWSILWERFLDCCSRVLAARESD